MGEVGIRSYLVIFHGSGQIAFWCWQIKALLEDGCRLLLLPGWCCIAAVVVQTKQLRWRGEMECKANLKLIDVKVGLWEMLSEEGEQQTLNNHTNYDITV